MSNSTEPTDAAETDPILTSLRYPFDVDTVFLRRRVLKNAVLEREEQRKGMTPVRVAILGGSTTSDVKDVLEIFLLDAGFSPTFFESEYNNYYDDAVMGNPLLHAFKPQVALVFTSSRNILYWPEAFASSERVEACLESELTRYRAIWDRLAADFGCMILQNNFDPPAERPLGPLDATLEFGRTHFVSRLNAAFAAEARKRKELVISDIHGIATHLGGKHWHSKENWYGFKIAASRAGIVHAMHGIARLLGALYGRTKKCLVLDLDNTLWGGVIGDDGLGGLKLGRDDALGEAYVEFQHYCLELKHRGVLLAVCSKNDEAVAKSGFTHPDSVLKLEDFAAFRANWDAKHENIRSIAKELNLGLDSFVFVDDNPAERAIVAAQLPAVSVPDIGSDVARYAEHLEREGYFDAATLSADDQKRAAFYESNAKRAELTAAFSNYGDYLRSLEMVAEIGPFHEVYLPRIAQLTNKTNQFNVTTRRYNLADITGFSKAPDVITLYGRLVNRFGDNGLVSVIVAKVKGQEALIDLWLMSCRVLKRDFELAMFDELVTIALARGAKRLVGEYVRTAKNNMVADHFEKLGFTLVEGEVSGDRSLFRFDIPEPYVRRNGVLREILSGPGLLPPATE